MEISLWVIIVIILIIIIAIALFYFLYEPAESNICQEEDLMTEEEAWTYYQTSQIEQNPFYLVAPDHTGPYTLTLKSIPKAETTCVGCGSTEIPFPMFCILKNLISGVEVEYQLEGSGDTAEVRTYKSGESTINLGRDCQTATISNQLGFPAPKWTASMNF